MKKIIVPFKDEDCIIQEVDEKELINLEAGGLFACYFLKRCVGVKQMYNWLKKYMYDYSHQHA